MAKSKVRKKKIKNKKSNKNEMLANKGSMSDILLNFAKPLLDEADNEEEFEKVILYSSTIWNIALEYGEEREELKRTSYEMLKHFQIASDEEMEIINFMIERKDRFYRNVRRMIVDHNIEFREDSINLDVVSFDI